VSTNTHTTPHSTRIIKCNSVHYDYSYTTSSNFTEMQMNQTLNESIHSIHALQFNKGITFLFQTNYNSSSNSVSPPRWLNLFSFQLILQTQTIPQQQVTQTNKNKQFTIFQVPTHSFRLPSNSKQLNNHTRIQSSKQDYYSFYVNVSIISVLIINPK
jgi:hypothetical protein